MSNPLRFPVPAGLLLPHSGPMCCIDALLATDASGGEARVLLARGHVLLGEQGLEECGYIELAAQTAGALQGYARQAAGLAPASGFLAGVQDFQTIAPAVENDVLTVRVQTLAVVGDVTLLEGSVWRNGELLAKGKLKVYVPSDDFTV